MGRRWALVAGTAIAMGCASAQEAPAPETTPPPPSPLVEAAKPYAQLRADLAFADNLTLSNAGQTREIHERLLSNPVKGMARARVAHAALIAADTPTFAAAIDRRTSSKRKRENFIAALNENPAVVRELDGADEAIQRILTTAARDANRMEQAGDRYIADAYRLQETGWARSKLPGSGSSRLTAAKTAAANRTPDELSLTPVLSEEGNTRPNLDTVSAWSAEWSAVPAGALPTLDTDRQIYMTNALVLAVRYAINDLDAADVDAYARPPSGEKRCFKNTRLVFDTCMAATRTGYEEAFCIGTHGFHDISRCVGWIADKGAPRG